LSKTDAAVFEAALGVLPDDLWRLAATTHAELVVIDVDTVAGHAEWARATSGAAKLAAYTRNRKLQGGELVLSKPLRTRDLADLITRLREGMNASASNDEVPPPAANIPHPPEPAHKRPAGADTSAGADIEDTRQSTASAPVEGHASTSSAGTLGECLLADDLIRPVSVQGVHGIFVCLDPERGVYTGSNELKPLQPLLDMPLEYAEPLAADAIAEMRKQPPLPMSRLVWLAALCASPGELAPNLNPQARYGLIRWPPIEREFPRHLRIATSMMKGFATLKDIAVAAEAPANEVADFINAYSALDYIASEQAPAHDDKAGRNGRGLFSRLRRSIGRD
jgi:hypothetical protein